jgi:protein-disulfide isomerase
MPRRPPLARIALCLASLMILAGCSDPPAAPASATSTAGPGLSVAPERPPPNAERNGRAWGPTDAPLKVVKFVDYQCPTCGRVASEYDPGIVEAFAATGKVRLEVRFLTFIGRESYDAALAALCAADQDAFWRMHRSIFLNQPSDGRENAGAFTKPRLRGMAAEMQLDATAFGECLDSEKHRVRLEEDRLFAQQYGIGAVPTVVINGRIYRGARSAEDLRQIFNAIAPDVRLDSHRPNSPS